MPNFVPCPLWQIMTYTMCMLWHSCASQWSQRIFTGLKHGEFCAILCHIHWILCHVAHGGFWHMKDPEPDIWRPCYGCHHVLWSSLGCSVGGGSSIAAREDRILCGNQFSFCFGLGVAALVVTPLSPGIVSLWSVACCIPGHKGRGFPKEVGRIWVATAGVRQSIAQHPLFQQAHFYQHWSDKRHFYSWSDHRQGNSACNAH